MPGTSLERPRFSVDATVQPGTGGSPEIRIDYRLNRGELLFERDREGYRAAYEVRVIFYAAKGKRQVAGDAFTRSLRAPTYAATRPIGEDIVDHVEFPLPPGKYLLQVAVTDLTAERISAAALEVEVPKEPQGLLWFSDLSLGTFNTAPGVTAERDRLLPLPSRRFGEEIVRFAAYGEVVDNRPDVGPDSTFRLTYRVVDDTGEPVARGDTTIVRRGRRTAFLVRPHLGAIPPGAYRFVVELAGPVGKLPGKGGAVTRDKRFEVEQSKVSVSPDARTSLEVLHYVATPAEVSEMARLQTDADRQAYWETFWLRRDSSPETPENEARDEFYQRVQYANQHFGVGGPGWRTDMGRIYITYGRPDEVVRNPFNFDRPPEEIWYYYRDRLTFAFEDRDGFGRFELVRTGNP